MKIVTVVGARPQFVKAAAISAAIDRTERADEIVIHTGQHYDASMSDVFFDQLNMRRPRYHLGIGSGSHGEQTGRMLMGIEEIMLSEKPDLALTYGDTNSTLACALAAAKLHVPIAHVEAGLRSFNRLMPEEVNRVLTDHVSEILLCPSTTSVQNLEAEGIRNGVHHVGDVMHDVFIAQAATIEAGWNPIALACGVDLGPYVVLTMHRPSNTDDPDRLRALLDSFRRVASSGVSIVWPVHPRFRHQIHDLQLPPNIHLIEPVGYREMLALVRDAVVVATDSGGLQKEAYWAGVPCVTLRGETEWGETVIEGWNVIGDADPDVIVPALLEPTLGGSARVAYGAGHAADSIVQILADYPLPAIGS